MLDRVFFARSLAYFNVVLLFRMHTLSITITFPTRIQYLSKHPDNTVTDYLNDLLDREDVIYLLYKQGDITKNLYNAWKEDDMDEYTKN